MFLSDVGFFLTVVLAGALPERASAGAAVGRRWTGSTSSTRSGSRGGSIAVAVLFALGLRLPLQPRLRRLPALAYAAGHRGRDARPRGPGQCRPRAARRALRSDPRGSLHALEAGRGRRRPAPPRREAHLLLPGAGPGGPAREGHGRGARAAQPASARAHRRSRPAADGGRHLRRADLQRGRARDRRPPDPGDDHGREPDRPRHPPGDPRAESPRSASSRATTSTRWRTSSSTPISRAWRDTVTERAPPRSSR